MDAEVFDAILADVAAGEAAYKAMQAHGVAGKAFYAHVALNEEARNKYARAKMDGLDRLADEIIAIADESRTGIITTTKPDGSVETKEADMVERARIQIDSRKWLLSKLAPKKYGERVDLTHAGPDGGPIVQRVENVVVDPKD